MPKRIPEETKLRATRQVLDHLEEYPNLTAACETVAGRLGFGAESLRRWVRQAQVNSGQRDGVTSSEADEIRQLRRENRELRDANAILKDGAVFFAGELDPRNRLILAFIDDNGCRSRGRVDLPRSCRRRAARSPRGRIGPGRPPTVVSRGTITDAVIIDALLATIGTPEGLYGRRKMTAHWLRRTVRGGKRTVDR